MDPPRRLILRSFLSPGDTVTLTATVRDLHRAYPGRFATDVRTPHPELWQHNPHITALDDTDADVEQIDMHYPLVHECNDRPYHFLHGFTQYLEEYLQLRIPLMRFGGDIHLAPEERGATPPGREWGVPDRYWILMAGGKYDFTTKWWDPARYQAVVDHFRGRVTFVQCGAIGDWHPPLTGVVDMVGRTSLRDLVRLMYFADGVVCPITFAMHLSAAVETPPDRGARRACVVIAGGREAPHWAAYVQHHFLHTIGELPCCEHGGCWRSRCHEVVDEGLIDKDSLCERPMLVSGGLRLPECMLMISAEEVIRRISLARGEGADARAVTIPSVTSQAVGSGRAVAPAIAIRESVLIDFPYSEVDAVILTGVLRTLRSRQPNWDMTVRTSSVSSALLRPKVPVLDADNPRQRKSVPWDRIVRLSWEPNRSAYAEFPSTRAVKCLLEEFGLRPPFGELAYELEPDAEALAWVDATIAPRLDTPYGVGRCYPAILVEDDAIADQFESMAADWPNELRLIRVCEAKDANRVDSWRVEIGGEHWVISPAALAALVSRISAVVAGPTLPLYLAAATKTHALGIWRDRHPAHQIDPCDHLIHLMPVGHESWTNGPPAATYFRRQYRHRVFGSPDELLALMRHFAAELIPRTQLVATAVNN